MSTLHIHQPLVIKGAACPRSVCGARTAPGWHFSVCYAMGGGGGTHTPCAPCTLGSSNIPSCMPCRRT